MQQNARTSRRMFQPTIGSAPLPLEHPCQIYPRVSSPEQIKNVSTEMQKDKSFALSCGWTKEQILLDDRDLGMSGQLRMEDRPAFNDMLRRIANGKIKAVVAINVDRLFRNKWGDESGKFMEICHRYGVIVVTPDFVYDFNISWHIERFKRRCEEAWNYLEYHVFGRLIPAMDRRGEAGFWTGGTLPFGYTIDTREKVNGLRNPNHYRYIVYEPHAKVIRWLFTRFQQLNGNVRALMREIEQKPLLFPDFDDTVESYIVQGTTNSRTKVPGGYTIFTWQGLRSLLMNRVYIGHWTYRGELMSTENHEPIVDLDTFTFAFNRLSPVKLDGTPNEAFQEGWGKQYRKRHFPDRPAYLKECIRTPDPKVKVYTQDTKLTHTVRTHYKMDPKVKTLKKVS
jgi:DNA invertase Pin-like site-specific DNA recombinase